MSAHASTDVRILSDTKVLIANTTTTDIITRTADDIALGNGISLTPGNVSIIYADTQYAYIKNGSTNQLIYLADVSGAAPVGVVTVSSTYAADSPLLQWGTCDSFLNTDSERMIVGSYIRPIGFSATYHIAQIFDNGVFTREPSIDTLAAYGLSAFNGIADNYRWLHGSGQLYKLELI
jgi:hypothetical protein